MGSEESHWQNLCFLLQISWGEADGDASLAESTPELSTAARTLPDWPSAKRRVKA